MNLNYDNPKTCDALAEHIRLWRQLINNATGVQPPIANAELVQKRLRNLRIEEKELEELLRTNRALQVEYERQVVPF